MDKVKIKGEHITLGQFLKKMDLISSGGETKDFIMQNIIKVNGAVEDRRGRKLRSGDVININDIEFLLE